jgi:Protein of unknown function (DUF3276)
VAYESNDRKMESVYGRRIKAGKRRTYFFDVRATRGNDYFLTITESRKRFNDDGYDRHKIFLYKEDFNKFLRALNEAVDYVKTELMPNFDFDAYNHDTPPSNGDTETPSTGDMETLYDGEPVENLRDEEKPTVEVKQVQVEEKAPAVDTGNNGATEEVDKW